MHPVVAQMTPSPEQKPAVLERGRDVVVTAGAGTGKTRTLVARYLSLLAEGLSIRRIVAITFTKKAAREMRNRVRKEMRLYLERQDLAPAERERWQERYRQLDAARIGTIHGLCSEILRAHPAEAGVDPRFEVLEEGQAGILQARAIEEALAWAASDAQAARLFTLLGERGLRSGLARLLSQRLDVGPSLEQMPPDLLDHWQCILHERQQLMLTALQAQPEWDEAVATLADNAADDPSDRMEMQRQEALASIRHAIGPLADQLVSLSGLNEINLVGGSYRRWPGDKLQLADVKESLRTLRGLWREQADVLGLKLTLLDELLAEAMPLMRMVFAFLRERYEAYKRERNVLDFDDLEEGALRLLRERSAVASRWERQAEAILVDEFQDTNGRQRDLVAYLNGDGNKLFIVGDAKQSIYRFRGADVTVFRSEQRRISEGGVAHPLETSYRAHRDLIRGLNDLLKPVLGERGDRQRPWAEPFAPLLHHREAPGPGFAPPHIELHLTVGSKGQGALDLAAAALTTRLVWLVENGEHGVTDHVESRPLDYGDIAILCRATRSFAAYEDALEQAGVPFLTVAGRGFYGRPEIRDLLNGLRALADPSDDLALVGLLRSPLLALSDAALYLLVKERDRLDRGLSLWDLLRMGHVQNTLTGADGHRAARAAGVISDLHGQVGRTSVADLLKALLDLTDCRAALVRAGQARAARNVAKLLADAHTSGIVNVGEFLEYVGNLRDSGAREGEARSTAEGAVQIMTVHAAKGLEFPVVVLGDITQKRQDRKGVLVDPDLGVVLRLEGEDGEGSAAYALAKLRERDQEDAEADRLLYVAATRTREKLILSGCIGLKRDGKPRKLEGWLGKLCSEKGLGLAQVTIGHDPEGDRAIDIRLQVGSTPVCCAIYEPQWQPRYRVAQPPPPIREPRVQEPHLLDPVRERESWVDERTSVQERTPPRRVWRVVPAVAQPRAPAWVVGSLVHEALAAWRFPRPGPADEAFGHWARARAREHGVSDARQLGDAARQTARLLLRFADHPLSAEMDTAERRWHEVPYSYTVNGNPESGIIDALYEQGGQWTIVEFKTDDLKDRAVYEALLAEEDYVAQAQRYFAAAAQLLEQEPRVILCLLNYAGTVQLESPLGSRTNGS